MPAKAACDFKTYEEMSTALPRPSEFDSRVFMGFLTSARQRDSLCLSFGDPLRSLVQIVAKPECGGESWSVARILLMCSGE